MKSTLRLCGDLEVPLLVGGKVSRRSNLAWTVVSIMPLALALLGCAGQPAGQDATSQDVAVVVDDLYQASMGELQGRTQIDLSKGFLESMRQVVETSDAYAAASLRIDDARSQIRTAESARRPQLMARANLGSLRESGGGRDRTSTGAMGQIGLSQLIFDGGVANAAVEGARAQVIATEALREVRVNELALEAGLSWINVWKQNERLALLREQQEEVQQLIEQLDRMVRSGLIDRAVLTGAQRQAGSLSIEESRLIAERAEAEIHFQRLYKQDPAALPLPESVMRSEEANAHARNWRATPDLIARAANIVVARSAVERFEAEKFPKLQLEFGASSPIQDDESDDIWGWLALEYEFSDGGARSSRVQSAQHQLGAAYAELRELKAILQSEFEADLVRLSAIERSTPLIARQVDLGVEELQTLRAQLATGQATLPQLLASTMFLHSMRDRAISLRAERETVLLSIAARSGGLGRLIGLVSEEN